MRQQPQTRGIDLSQQGVRLDNIPDAGTLTGLYEIDFHGCWWQYVPDQGAIETWIIGDQPEQEGH